jgi:molybdopterin-biosynthesis enzyme MoeA-like protein
MSNRHRRHHHRRRDHPRPPPGQAFARIVELLAARGLTLDWALYHGDDRERLTDPAPQLAGGDIVFSCGGIGNTPDDHTRQAAAAARASTWSCIRTPSARFAPATPRLGREVTDYALDMGRFPAGSRIIPNPFNRIPGFSRGDHHFVPGFPQMAWPMIEWVLDTYYADRFNQRPSAEAAILVWKGIESALTPLMLKIEAEYPGLKVFSLPFLGSADVRATSNSACAARRNRFPPAMELMRREVPDLGYEKRLSYRPSD